MHEAALLSAALLACTLGMGWLALAMERHWTQVCPDRPHAGVARLRSLGALALATSLALCLRVDNPSMAALVWVMALAASALAVTLALAWRPRWLQALAWSAR